MWYTEDEPLAVWVFRDIEGHGKHNTYRLKEEAHVQSQIRTHVITGGYCTINRSGTAKLKAISGDTNETHLLYDRQNGRVATTYVKEYYGCEINSIAWSDLRQHMGAGRLCHCQAMKPKCTKRITK